MFSGEPQHAVLRWGRRIEERFARPVTAATLWGPTVVTALSAFERPMRVTTVDDRFRLYFSTISNLILGDPGGPGGILVSPYSQGGLVTS